jgi:predicted transcriptional regulator
MDVDTITMDGRVLLVDTNQSIENAEPILKAIASERRLAILRYLADYSSGISVNEIADAMDMPTSTATMHINILESAGLIRTELQPASRGLQKICARVYNQIVVQLPSSLRLEELNVDVTMPVGAYTDCHVTPTCGLLSEHGVIGQFDDPATFYEPDRIYAQLLWFKRGYVEYRFPKRLPGRVSVESVQISMELCSEAPLHNDDWPSDISLWINGIKVGSWTSPGDFGGERGALTPKWWEEWNSQFGLLKVWKVTEIGSFIDGENLSRVTVADLSLESSDFIAVRIGVDDDAKHVGGINIFGRAFGNYPQDIVMRLRLRQVNT